MKKRWNILIISCWVMIIAIVVAWFIFLGPNYLTYRVFHKVGAGNWSGVTKEYNALSTIDKNRVDANLEDFATVVTQEYIDGKRTFASAAASFDAIDALDKDATLYKKYMDNICENEYRRAISELVRSYISFDGELQNSSKRSIEAVEKRLDNTARERIMIEMLNEWYESFIKGTVTEEEIGILANIVTGLSVYEATDYVDVIRTNVHSVKTYRGYYDEAKAAYDAQNYFQAINICDQVEVDPMDADYAEKYRALSELARADGKIYYEKLLNEYVDMQDAVNANTLIARLTEIYGSDFDSEGAKLALAQPWQRAFLSVLKDPENIVKKEAGVSSVSADSMYLYDIRDDGTPELFLFDSKKTGGDATLVYVFAAENESYVYAGTVYLVSFCSDSHLLALPDGFTSGADEAAALLSFDGSKLVQEKYCYQSGEKYYVDGAESSDVDYLTAQSACVENSLSQGIADMKTKKMSEGEDYILTFGADN